MLWGVAGGRRFEVAETVWTTELMVMNEPLAWILFDMEDLLLFRSLGFDFRIGWPVSVRVNVIGQNPLFLPISFMRVPQAIVPVL